MDEKPKLKWPGDEVSKGLVEWLLDAGATPAQTGSKVVAMIADGLAEGEVSGPATARERMDAIEQGLKQAEDYYNWLDNRCRALGSKTDEISKRWDAIDAKLSEADLAAGQHVITDEATKNAVVAYRAILADTFELLDGQSVIREAVTDAVLCKAIEAASYGCWRSIMGSKHREDGR